MLIRTECAHCAQPMVIEIDHQLNIEIKEGGVDPLVFTPFVDHANLTDPSIIDVF